MDRQIIENLCYLYWDIYNSLDLRTLLRSYSTIQYSSFVLSIITCIIGFPTNLIVIFVTGFLMRKNKYKIWFLNLALADFTFLLFQPFAARSFIKGWSYGSSVCKLYNFLTFVNMYAGIYILTVLNIDRALSVAKPIWHRRFLSQKFCRCMCAVIWISSTTFSIPTIIYSDVHGPYEFKQCILSFNHRYKSVQSSFNYSLENQTSLSDLFSFQRELCRNFSNNIEMSAVMKSAVEELREERFSVLHFVVPLSVFGYIIPLSVILFSNIIIAFHVKNSKMAATSRLYRVVIVAIMSFFCVRTPYVCACIAAWVSMYTLQFTRVFKISFILPLVYNIFVTNSLVNPVVYVLVGKQVRSELMRFLRKT